MLRKYLILSLLGGAVLLPAGLRAQTADLTGVWTLDEAASDTLELEPSDTAQARPSRFRLGYGYPPRARSIRDPGRMRAAVDAVAEPAAKIVIVQDDSTVTISFDSEQPITLHLDGRRVRRAWLDEPDVQVRVRPSDRGLRIERLLESQIEIRDTYEVADATLTITTEVEGPILRRLRLRRVYHMEPPVP